MPAEKLYYVFGRDGILVIVDGANPKSLITDASGDLERKLGTKAAGEGGYLYYVPAAEAEIFEKQMKAFEKYMKRYSGRKR
jgi:hypothetical protein